MNYYNSNVNRRGILIHRMVKILIVIMIVGFLALVMAPCVSGYYETKERTVTITDKESVCDSDGNGGTSCKYLVFTDTGTFELTDSLIGARRFNSSDVYGQIKRCHSYDITYYGWRMPWASGYPNIKKIVQDNGRVEGCET